MEQIPGEELVRLGYLAGFTRAKAPKSRVGNKAATKAWNIYYAGWAQQFVKKITRDIRKLEKLYKAQDRAMAKRSM